MLNFLSNYFPSSSINFQTQLFNSLLVVALYCKCLLALRVSLYCFYFLFVQILLSILHNSTFLNICFVCVHFPPKHKYADVVISMIQEGYFCITYVSSFLVTISVQGNFRRWYQEVAWIVLRPFTPSPCLQLAVCR